MDVESRLVAAAFAAGLAMAARGTAARSTSIAAIAFVAAIAVQSALENALESAVAAAVQVRAILAAVGTASVVAVAVTGIGTGRMAFPVPVVRITAGATLVDFAAELRSTYHALAELAAAATTLVATAAA
jgi:hypothetical protein